MKILVINAGSSSIKYQLIDMDGEKLIGLFNFGDDTHTVSLMESCRDLVTGGDIDRDLELPAQGFFWLTVI